MMWKVFIFAFLAVGVLGDIEIPNDKREQLKQILTEQCKKAGAEDKVPDVETAGRNFIECVKGLFDINQIKNEIEAAKPVGALDEVFKKYCAKSPQLNGCIDALFDGVTPCVPTENRGHIATAKNSTRQLIDFICYKDGDRIALFIAEGGPECMGQSTESVKQCFAKVQENKDEIKNYSDEEKCAKFDEVSTCVGDRSGEVFHPTPGIMAESLFRFIRKGLPCTPK
uniref:Uncharacterized protein n=1 Tax=Lonomia obliqua TaxID=304329 RepID=Q5MGF6_LONON|nr:hypothetical protein 31 [Lonomia obliqua]